MGSCCSADEGCRGAGGGWGAARWGGSGGAEGPGVLPSAPGGCGGHTCGVEGAAPAAPPKYCAEEGATGADGDALDDPCSKSALSCTLRVLVVLLVLLGGTSADEGEGKGQGCSAAKEAAALGFASRSHMIWSAIALFGRRWLTAIGSRVIGLHPCLRSHASMAWRSYVYPSVPITGSCMRDCVIGHTSPGEPSRLSMLLGAAWMLPAMSRCCLQSGCLHRVDKEAPT